MAWGKKRVVRKGRAYGRSRGRKLQSAEQALSQAAHAKLTAMNQHATRGKVKTSMASAPAKRSRKRTSGTSVVRVKTDEKEGTGPYEQWSNRYDQATFGKLTNNKLLRRNIEKVIFQFNNIGRFGGSGRQWLGNYISANAIPEVNANVLPCVVFDLTSVTNTINGSIVSYPPCHQLYKRPVSGDIKWLALPGIDSTGATNGNWTVEYSPNVRTVGSSYPGDQSILKWASAEFELWGCQQKSTKYTVELCQFHEDVVPDLINASGTGSYEEFWDSMIKPYAFSPLAHTKSGFNAKKYKVWKRYNIMIDPTSTTESDPSPHCKVLKLFYRLNRYCKYDWEFANANGVTIGELQTNNHQLEDAENKNTVHPNARLFLMIRATNFVYKSTAIEPTTLTVADTPSISWKIRTCHIINQ